MKSCFGVRRSQKAITKKRKPQLPLLSRMAGSIQVIPVYGFVKEYAKEKGIEYTDMTELLQHPKIVGLFRARIDTLQQQFAHYEQIKRFTLLPEPFSMERGELTNTLKLKRAVVAKNYSEQIEKMYEESEK